MRLTYSVLWNREKVCYSFCTFPFVCPLFAAVAALELKRRVMFNRITNYKLLGAFVTKIIGYSTIVFFFFFFAKNSLSLILLALKNQHSKFQLDLESVPN